MKRFDQAEEYFEKRLKTEKMADLPFELLYHYISSFLEKFKNFKLEKLL